MLFSRVNPPILTVPVPLQVKVASQSASPTISFEPPMYEPDQIPDFSQKESPWLRCPKLGRHGSHNLFSWPSVFVFSDEL